MCLVFIFYLSLAAAVEGQLFVLVFVFSRFYFLVLTFRLFTISNFTVILILKN